MSAAGGGGGAGAAVRAGHLRKLKTMKKKYFVLRADTPDCSARLEYYESEKKYKSGAAPRRVIPLKSCYNITRRLDLKQKHVIALFTKEEQFCVVAENEQDLHGWLAAILKQHRDDDASEELRHPIQHVWQVNVQKKGLGASKNIQGLYNLCLTDKTLSLVKIKSHNNVISDLGIPEKVEYSLKNIRRCGDSECFFYMEVGRQTATGAGELWMHTDDSNIAQSMHSTIYLAMRNCAKETENERDHIVIPKRSDSEGSTVAHRRSTYSADSRGRAGLANDAGTLRNRCDSMPSRPSSSFEVERPPQRLADLDDIKAHASSPDILSLYQECNGAETSRSVQKCTKSNAMLSSKTICTDCEIIRNAGEDKRNGRFAHLLELELQHVEPCIRTRLYAKLLKDIEAVKGLHLKDLDEKDVDLDALD